ncbi:hypothetical protein FDF74_12670 [Clostridium niameyense]|uniref:Uncharacterized protein n=1 Tax=Clostridium niameyense TaxID=1622073 RepID=A0A6M0RCR2_9CLOT|nr:hypothetical protein [Clostridium niameyense]NEZ48024.1 hypothetical protein [Clostridium niameyense]
MSNELFGRKIEVYVGTRKWTSPELDIEFKTEFDTTPIPNEAECSLYNLAPNSREWFSKGRGLILNAGYGNNIGTIFDGVIAGSETKRDGVDIETTVKLIDVKGNYLNNRIGYTYGRGATSEYLIRNVLDCAGGMKPNILNLGRNLTYPRGFAAYGKILDVVKRLVKEADSKLIIHNSSISIMPNRNGIETGFLLNSKTGLISVDKIDKPDNISTHKIKMLLNHAIAPYSLLQIESDQLNGTVLVISGKHDSSFTTEVEVRTL